MAKVIYTKQADGTIIESKVLDDPQDSITMLETRRAALQGQMDFFQQLIDVQLKTVQMQLNDLDEQLAALSPLVDTKPINGEVTPVDLPAVSAVESVGK